MTEAVSIGELSLKGNSASTVRARDAAYKQYEAFCAIYVSNFVSLETVPADVYINDKWWTKSCILTC